MSSNSNYCIPKIKLNNGVEIPFLGLSVWQNPREECMIKQCIKEGIKLGYRLIDCFYAENEKNVGCILQEQISEGVINRKDLFLIGKYCCTNSSQDFLKTAFLNTLKNLQTDYVDLYLIQWPVTSKEDENPTLFSNVDLVNTWKAMEELYKKGLTRAIGLSNFNTKQIECILKNCTVYPQVNQIECHLYLNHIKLRTYCIQNSIVVISYNSFAKQKNSNPENKDIFKDKRIIEIAERYNKTPAQIALKYNIQLENVVISEICKKEKLIENIKIFDFYLAPEDMRYLKTFTHHS